MLIVVPDLKILRQILIPKSASRVSIYDEEERSRLIARINLSKLDITTKFRRLIGECNQILMIESSDTTARRHEGPA